METNISHVQKQIRIGTHGEDYGSWMSNPVFYVYGGMALVALVLAVLSFAVFKIKALGIVFDVICAVLAVMLGWMAWIRRQYAFGKGGMMERVHQTILSSLDFDGQGEPAGGGLRFRSHDHPRGADLAKGEDHRPGLLGGHVQLQQGPVREVRGV